MKPPSLCSRCSPADVSLLSQADQSELAFFPILRKRPAVPPGTQHGLLLWLLCPRGHPVMMPVGLFLWGVGEVWPFLALVCLSEFVLWLQQSPSVPLGAVEIFSQGRSCSSAFISAPLQTPPCSTGSPQLPWVTVTVAGAGHCWGLSHVHDATKQNHRH